MGDSDMEGVVQSSGIDPRGSNWISAQAPTAPAAAAPTPAQVALPYDKTPEQLGWSAAEAQRFRAAGINLLPSYMNKAALYSTGANLGGDDPIQFFIDAQQKPTSTAGKYGDAISVVGIDPSSPAWDESAQRAYSQWLIHSKWKPNQGAFQESVMPAVQGIGSIASVVGGLGALGAFAAPVAGAASGGLSAAEASAMAGESAAGYGAAGASGAAGTVGAGGGYLGALEGGMGAYGAGGAGEAGNLGAIGTGATGTAAGSNALANSIATGQAAGADVGMGAGGSSAVGGAGVAGGSSIWDSISGLLGGTGSGGLSDSALLSLLNAGIGGVGTYLGGQAQADANKDANKTLWDMYNQSRADTASQRALLDQSLPFMQDRTYNAQSYMPTLPTLQNEVSVDYANDPIYQAQKDEMMKTLNRRYAAQGGMISSDADNAITRNVLPFMQDAYSRNLDTLNRTNQNALSTYGLGYQQQGDIYNRGLDLTKIGAGAASSAGQNALSAGNSIAQNQTTGGNNTANMYGNMAGVGMGSINNYMLYNLLNK